ncbi:hypothetical protein ABZ354_03475 [Streptomyces sp. NPDC005925]|uniref:hypothetical protein n=1 Tax=Streptomyces sp. NPDC005925 TaxID=3157172 RepID=UPI003410553E
MRRTARLLTGGALALAAAGLATAPAHGAGPTTRVYAGTGSGTDTGVGRGMGMDGLEVRPSSAVPGSRVTVNTGACGDGVAAQGDAAAVGGGPFALAPGAHGRGTAGRFRVPPGAQPGTYEIVVTCARNGQRVTGDLAVVPVSQQGHTYPHGSVKTGVGGALGPDPVQTAAGVAALAVAAAGGTWLLHRRARGDGI